MIRQTLFALALAAATTSTYAGTVSFPYTNDFDDADVSDFVTSSVWAATGGGFQNTIGSSSGVGKASVKVPALGASLTDFKLSSTFVATAQDGGNLNYSSSLGFAVLAADANFGGGSSNPYYLIDLGNGQNVDSTDPSDGSTGMVMRILRIASSNSYINPEGSSVEIGKFYVGETYTLEVTGTYVDGDDADTDVDDLLLEFTVSGAGVAGGTQTISGIDDNPLTGEHFGYRHRHGPADNVDMIVQSDNFSITGVPEPGSLGPMALGVVAVISRRRK